MSVKDYLSGLKSNMENTVKGVKSFNSKINTGNATNDILATKLLQASALINAQGIDPKISKDLLKSFQNQEKLLNTLIEGDSLTNNQFTDLNVFLKEFNKEIKNYDLKVGDLIEGFTKAASKDIPEAFKNRLNNDLKAILKNSQQLDPEYLDILERARSGEKVDAALLELVRDISLETSDLVEEIQQSRLETRSFWDNFSFKLSNIFTDMKNALSDKDLWKDILKVAFALGMTPLVDKLIKEIRNIFPKIGPTIEEKAKKASNSYKNAIRASNRFPNLALKAFELGDKAKSFLSGKVSTFKELKVVKKSGELLSKIPGSSKISSMFAKITKFSKGISKIVSIFMKPISKIAQVAKKIPILSKVLESIFIIIDYVNGYNKATGDMITKMEKAKANVWSGLTFNLISQQKFSDFFNTLSGSKSSKSSITTPGLNTNTAGMPTIKGMTPVGNLNGIKLPPVPKIGKGNVGDRLASVAEQIAGRRSSPGGWCLNGVNEAFKLTQIGSLPYNSAYQALAGVASNPNFTPVNASLKDLPKLPRGSVVIWSKGNSPHGHISISDGKGNELSDYKGRQKTTLGQHGYPNVFIPKGTSFSPTIGKGNLLSTFNTVSSLARTYTPDLYNSINNNPTVGNVKNAYSSIKSTLNTLNSLQLDNLAAMNTQSQLRMPSMPVPMPNMQLPQKVTEIFDTELAMLQTLLFN